MNHETPRIRTGTDAGPEAALETTPKAGMKARVLYIGVGLAVIGGSFATGLEGWERVAFPTLGMLVVATGKTGWWASCALLGLGRKG